MGLSGYILCGSVMGCISSPVHTVSDNENLIPKCLFQMHFCTQRWFSQSLPNPTVRCQLPLKWTRTAIWKCQYSADMHFIKSKPDKERLVNSWVVSALYISSSSLITFLVLSRIASTINAMGILLKVTRMSVSIVLVSLWPGDYVQQFSLPFNHE